MNCVDCGKPLPPRVAGLATRPAGDEYVHSWFFCRPCGVYTRETWIDRWSGTSTHIDRVEKDAGDRMIALIAQCPRALDDKCDCIVHQTVGVGW